VLYSGFVAAADAGTGQRREERAGVIGALLDVVFDVADLRGRWQTVSRLWIDSQRSI
jgi:hypothetical protein